MFNIYFSKQFLIAFAGIFTFWIWTRSRRH